MRLTAGAIGVAAGEFHDASGPQDRSQQHSIAERTVNGVVASISKPAWQTFYRYSQPEKSARGVAGIRADLQDRSLTIDQLAHMRIVAIAKLYDISRRYAWQIRDQARRGELVAEPPAG